MNKLTILNSYLVCALWAESFDYSTIEDIRPSTIEQAKKDIDSFLEQAEKYITDEWNSEQVGHDLWLTRNYHGTGFWDRDYPNGKELTEIAHKFKSLNIFQLEDETIVFE